MTFSMPEPGRQRRFDPSGRRPRALVPTLVVLGVLLVLFSIFTGIYTDLLWFRSVDYQDVFTTVMVTRLLLFLVFGLVMGSAIAANIVLAHRLRPPFRGMSPEQQSLDRYRVAIDPYRKIVVVSVAGLLALIAAGAAAGKWRTWLLWRNGTDFGQKDPEFGLDVSFYTFDYPWWRFVLGFFFAVTILSLLAAAATHYLYGGLRLQGGDRATPAAQAHLSVLLGVFVLLKAVAYWLDRYGLALASDPLAGSFTGLKYRDVNAVLPAKTILAVIALICAALFFANVVRRTWLLPGIGLGLLVLSAILIGGVYPALVQQFQVKPSEADKEAPYISRNIEATRDAYDIADAEITEYNAKTTATRGQLRGASDTTASVRLLDPAVVSPTFKQDEQVRSFYEFPDSLDVDRYTVDGKNTDTVVAVREMDLDGLPAGQRNWTNDHTVYTHGYGFVAARGNTREADGRPKYVSENIPPTSQIGDYESRIYFGESSPNYSIVGAPEGSAPAEFDYPDDKSANGQRNNTYEGEGGVSLGSMFNKALYAAKFQDKNILLSERVNEDSKILYERNPRDRVEKVAPWLTVDGDPYPAVVDGRILWIVDGYTTSNGYPYSSRTTLGEATSDSLSTGTRAVATQPEDEVNYIRNSVKATVDAYDGTVTLYEWDTEDPVLKSWSKAFPGTVKPRSEISDGLMAHLRYPQDLFKVQRELFARYHVEDPKAFYGGGDFWRVPKDPTREGGEDQPPYYLTLQMPGASEASFSLTTTYVPAGNRENLSAFMSVAADPGKDYGKMQVLQLPRNQVLDGPQQVQNNFLTNAEVAQEINLLRRGDSEVVYGNLLTLPVGGGLLYVEPVYVQASTGTSFPLLRKVLVSFGDRIAFEDTLEEALDVLFSGESGAVTEEPKTGAGETPAPEESPPPTGEQPDALQKALEDADKAFRDGEAALKRGDFAAYGEAQKRLQDALERAIAAEGGGGTATPSPTPSPTGGG